MTREEVCVQDMIERDQLIHGHYWHWKFLGCRLEIWTAPYSLYPFCHYIRFAPIPKFIEVAFIWWWSRDYQSLEFTNEMTGYHPRGSFWFMACHKKGYWPRVHFNIRLKPYK